MIIVFNDHSANIKETSKVSFNFALSEFVYIELNEISSAYLNSTCVARQLRLKPKKGIVNLRDQCWE